MSSASGSKAAGSVGRFGAGLGLLSEAVRLLRQNRSLWALASVPVLFATLLVGTAGTLIYSNVPEIHETLRGLLPVLEPGAWWTWIWVGPGIALFWLLGWLGVAMAFAVGLVAALLLANLLSAPFLDQLSQRVERIVLEGPAAGAEGLSSVLGETLRSFLAELQRLLFLGGVWVSLTAVGFVLPGAHLLTGPLLIGLTVLFLPLDYAGFALDRRQVSFGGRRRWIRANLPTMTGFGATAFLACLVPGLNLLMLPAFVTAGTLLVLRLDPGGVEPSADGV